MKYQINGVGLNVHDQGDGEPVLIFLHYWGGSSRTWREVIKRLETNFRCLAYDHRGWGDSDAATSYRIQDLADDAEALIETYRLQHYVLVGSLNGRKGRSVSRVTTPGRSGWITVGRTVATCSNGCSFGTTDAND
jgi:pimeloyl-ACP methyl ester carboxylesterase